MMELFGSLRSPYVRKVRVAAHELGLSDEIKLITVVNTPQSVDPILRDVTPVDKIPALRLADGEVVIESLLIAERLDAMSSSPRLFGTGQTRAATLFLQAVADGIIEAAFRWLAEGWRPGDAASPVQQEMMIGRIDQSLDWLEARQLMTGEPMVGEIAAGVALSYLDFRLGSLDWREGRPRLSEWYAETEARAAMRATGFDAEDTAFGVSSSAA